LQIARTASWGMNDELWASSALLPHRMVHPLRTQEKWHNYTSANKARHANLEVLAKSSV